MLKFNIEKIKQVKDEHYFKVSVVCSSKSKIHYAHQKNIVEMIANKFNLDNCDFIASKSDDRLSKHVNTGTYVFRIKEKIVDILKKPVIIDKPKIEAETPVIEESKKEASLISETLPSGLKSTTKKTKTTARRKRTTRKKKTEE